MTTAIVLAAHGSMNKKTAHTIENFSKYVQSKYPKAIIRTVYTSARVHGHMKRQGELVLTLWDILIELAAKNIKNVLVQSLHIVAGKEYQQLVNLSEKAREEELFKNITVGSTLIEGNDNIENIVEALFSEACEKCIESEALLFMGHGTGLESNAYYEILSQNLEKKAANVFLGALDAFPKIDEVCKKLHARNIKKVYLRPFLFAVGHHATEDMGGEKASSWKSILESHGFSVELILQGVGESPVFMNIWAEHMENAFKAFDHSA